MARYKVEKRDSHFYVVGLRPEYGEGSDTLILYHYSDSPDVDSPTDLPKMYGALYDLLQCHEGLKQGDIIQTSYGDFECQGCHLQPLFPMPTQV
jgi:hypothetical protein